MESFLYHKRPTARQMYLDPRTKILLSLTVTFITLANSGHGIMDYVKLCAAVVPLVFLVILRKYMLVVYYIGMYVLAVTLPHWLMPYLPPVINLLFTGMIAVATQAIPSMSMFCFIVMTTTVGEFMAAMDKLHVPKKISVPISSMFRFFPTIREEYVAIRDAMRLRRIGSWRNPIEMLEFRMVPLLMELVSIGNELSASAMTRGLNAPNKRTNVCPIGFHLQDVIVLGICGALLVLLPVSSVMGW